MHACRPGGGPSKQAATGGGDGACGEGKVHDGALVRWGGMTCTCHLATQAARPPVGVSTPGRARTTVRVTVTVAVARTRSTSTMKRIGDAGNRRGRSVARARTTQRRPGGRSKRAGSCGRGASDRWSDSPAGSGAEATTRRKRKSRFSITRPLGESQLPSTVQRPGPAGRSQEPVPYRVRVKWEGGRDRR